MSRWPLHEKARSGDESGLRNLLDTKVYDVNTRNRQNKTPLLCADYTKPEIVHLLLQRGADVHVRNHQLQSPLYLAVAAENIENTSIARHLIELGADVNTKTNTKRTALHVAVEKGNLELVKLLVENGADFDVRDNTLQTPLYCAVSAKRQENNSDVIKYLLEHGADPNMRATYQITPLLRALQSYELSMIRAFLNQGGDLGVKNAGGETAAHYAARNTSYVEVLEFVLVRLLAAGFNVNERNSLMNGSTPLHDAIRSGNVEGCVVLFRHGADVNAKCHCDGSPLFIAIQHGSLEMFEQLLKLGSRVNESWDKCFLQKVLIRYGRFPCRAVQECILLRHIAQLMCLGSGIDEETRTIIDKHRGPRCYFERCVTELEKMKTRKIYEDVSLVDLETKSDAVIAGYARNEELVQDFEDSKEEFPIFARLAAKRFETEVMRQRQLKKAAATLGKILRLNAEISRMIVEYLEDDDLKHL